MTTADLADSHVVAPGRTRAPATLISARAVTAGPGGHLRELWRCRALFWMLTWRVITVRYRHMLIGSAWAVVQPFCLMLVFTVFLGLVTRVPTDGMPYPLFFFSGLWIWQFVAQAIQQGSAAVQGNAHIVSKVYFPRAFLPGAAVVGSLVDLAVAFPALAALMWFYATPPAPLGMVVFLAFLAFTLVMALGLALWTAALQVLYRDMAYLLPFVLQVWMFCSPIIYPSSLVPDAWQPLYAINPMVGIVASARWAFAGGAPVEAATLAISAAASLAVLLGGAWYFRRHEARFVDLL